MSEGVVEIYTDGACRNNPGPGGWAYLVRGEGAERVGSGFEAATTNNRMELMAVIRALESLNGAGKVQVYTDSQYVQKGISEWIHSWKRRGWKTADKKPVKNEDLWRALDAVSAKHQIKWQWVKGHAGHPENELVDQLANQAIEDATDRP